eukprot:m.38129 g.38129  ORF g.38129 m.38129 type:complete len:166 (+) comp11461_c0_seq3:402-899(+)
MMDELSWRLRRRQRDQMEEATAAADQTWQETATEFVRALPTSTEVPTVERLRRILQEAKQIEEQVQGRETANKLLRIWPREYLEDLEVAMSAYDDFTSKQAALLEMASSDVPIIDANLKSLMDRAVAAYTTLFVDTNSTILYVEGCLNASSMRVTQLLSQSLLCK